MTTMHNEPGVGLIDKTPQYRYAVYSQDRRDLNAGSYLESSCLEKTRAERFFAQYKTWGLPDTIFYLVDWDERKLLDTYKPA